jgi:hypothetical protein
MRAIKRERYAKKELTRLKKVLGIEENGDIEMKNIENIATVVDAKSIQADTEDASEEKILQEENEGERKELMQVDPVKQKYNKKTMRDEHGNYPVWMSRREVKNRSIGNRKNKKKQKRKRLRDKEKKKQ